MKKDSATNTFTGGLVQDFNPLNNLTLMTDVLTDCLNGTLITYNGNEYVLLNDMGNGRVETAYLPEGFIPVGTAELGGIIYIVSYNPITNLSLIGSFPSPERNITSDEVSDKETVILSKDNLFDTFTYKNSNGDNITETAIKNPKYKLVLLDKEVNPGDKFQVFGNVDKYASVLSAYGNVNYDINADPRYLKLHLVCVDKQGKIIFLDDSLVWYDDNGYYINQSETANSSEIDLDEYRDVVSSNYSVFTSKSKGTLAVLAELECIDSFEVSWNAKISDYIIKDTDGQVVSNKKAEVYLYLNWTNNCSVKNKINLNNLLILDEENNQVYKNTIKYPVRFDNGSLPGTELAIPDTLNTRIYLYLNPPYTTDFTILDNDSKLTPTSLRLNDGSDNDFIIKTFDLLYTSGYDVNDNKYENQIKTYKVIPGMPFGLINYLSQNITINYNKIGTGATDLVEWRYYTNDSNIVINWGLDCYPELNKSVESVLFDFHEIGKNDLYVSPLIDNGYFYDENLLDSENPANFKFKSIVSGYSEPENNDFPSLIYAICNRNMFPGEGLSPATDSSFSYSQQIPKKSSYSGHFTETIYYNKSFKKDSCYLVRMSVNYTGQTRYYFRYLYTAPIFNQVYVELKILDFSTLKLGDYIQMSMSFITHNFGTSDAAKVTSHDVTYYKSEIDSDGNITKRLLDTSEITKYKEEDSIEFNGFQRDTLNISGDFELKPLYKDLSGNEFNVLSSSCKFTPSIDNNLNFEYSDSAKEYLLNKESNNNKIEVNYSLEWNPSKVGEYVYPHINGTITIDTPFESNYGNKSSRQINKKLSPITTAVKEVNFLATKNTFEGEGNAFPSSGNEIRTKLSIYLDTSLCMNSVMSDSDITKLIWQMSSISSNLNNESAGDFVTSYYRKLNQKGACISDHVYSNICMYTNSDNDGLVHRDLFKLFAIKARYGNCVFGGYANDLTNESSNIARLAKLYKWVDSNESIDLSELEGLASFYSYLFNPKITINADADLSIYIINNSCDFEISEQLNVPNNMYININKTLYSSEIPISSVQISTNTLLNYFSNLNTTIYVIPYDEDNSKYTLYTESIPSISFPYTITYNNKIASYITPSTTFVLKDTSGHNYRTLTLRIEDERLIVIDNKYTRTITDTSYFSTFINVGSEWNKSNDKWEYPSLGYLLMNIIE